MKGKKGEQQKERERERERRGGGGGEVGREKLRKTQRKYERRGREKYREDKTCGMAILNKWALVNG